MEQFILRHLENYSLALSNCIITEKDGEVLELSAGISRAVAMVDKVKSLNRTLCFIGNGGSASIASHMSIDFWNTAGIKSLAFNDSSQLTCLGNDYGYSQIFQKPLEMFMSQDDLLFAISSSGKSENILNGARAARAKGGAVITLSGFEKDNPLSTLGDLNFYLPSSHYGIVEVNHQLLCHCILDTIMGVSRG